MPDSSYFGNFFGPAGIQRTTNGTFLVPAKKSNALAGDNDVMMISDLGKSLGADVNAPAQLYTSEYPWWAYLLAGAALGVAVMWMIQDKK